MKHDFSQKTSIFKDNLFLGILQFFISGIAFGAFIWNTVAFIKSYLLDDYEFHLHSWVYIFFHPNESTLLNYIGLCVALGIYGALVYFSFNRERLFFFKAKFAGIRYGYLLFALILQMAGLIFLPCVSLSLRIILTFCSFLMPFLYLIKIKRQRRILILLTTLLFVMISLEPLATVKGPAYLMNEYADLYGTTVIKGNIIDNREFLHKLSDGDIKAIDFLSDATDHKPVIGSIGAPMPKKSKIARLFSEFKNKSLEPLQQQTILRLANSTREAGIVTNLKRLDVEEVKRFYFANLLEYEHQNMSRGQINHIGHILNPINEYELGKPIKDIYMQYGLGNTLLMKWTMGIFGGTSLQNYYKGYIYYVIYFLFYLLMLYLLFDDILYISLGFAFLAFAFYYQGFIAFELAPGILPTIHFLDVFVIMLFLSFIKTKHLLYMGLAALLTVASIAVNRQFGIILAAAQGGALLLYVLDNKQKGRKITWLLSTVVFILACAVTFHFAQVGNLDSVFSFFLIGLFSWPANFMIIVLTICYLVVSYTFMIVLKESRHYTKYIFVLIFIYTQGLFTYYYWSGLSNHLPTIIPFAGLQLVLMVYIADKELLLTRAGMRQGLMTLTRIIVVLLAIGILFASKNFYTEKIKFRRIFFDHKTYEWKFNRARVITTINPQVIENSIDLIRKYSDKEKGIYIISRYDNLLPYLSQQYSKMPFFAMSWHLLSDKETDSAINKIRTDKATYLFVDSNIKENNDDLWTKLFSDDTAKDERAARFDRYRELYRIYSAVINDYELIEQGSLLTVYRRKD